MCSKPEVSVRKFLSSGRIYADNPKELAVKMAGRYKGTVSQFEALTAGPIKSGELLQWEDEKGLYYETKKARERRLAGSSKSPSVGYINTPSMAMAGGSR